MAHRSREEGRSRRLRTWRRAEKAVYAAILGSMGTLGIVILAAGGRPAADAVIALTLLLLALAIAAYAFRRAPVREDVPFLGAALRIVWRGHGRHGIERVNHLPGDFDPGRPFTGMPSHRSDHLDGVVRPAARDFLAATVDRRTLARSGGAGALVRRMNPEAREAEGSRRRQSVEDVDMGGVALRIHWQDRRRRRIDFLSARGRFSLEDLGPGTEEERLDRVRLCLEFGVERYLRKEVPLDVLNRSGGLRGILDPMASVIVVDGRLFIDSRPVSIRKEMIPTRPGKVGIKVIKSSKKGVGVRANGGSPGSFDE